MMPLIIHEAAEEELWREVAYYEREAAGLGLDFLSEAERGLQRIQAGPARWQRANHGTRRVLLLRFPHTIYYRELPEAVWIVAVAPQRRRPFYWRSRLGDNP